MLRMRSIGLMKGHFWIAISVALVCMGCHPDSHTLNPQIYYSAPPRQMEKLYDPTNECGLFPPLSAEENSQEWARELYLGRKFGQEMDFYRALTCFKRALFLHNECHPTPDRSFEIEYEIFFTYYLAGKYKEAVEVFETGNLSNVPTDFPVVNNLTIALYDSYVHIDQVERANQILNFINTRDPEVANKLVIERAIFEADFTTMEAIAAGDNVYSDVVCEFLTNYTTQSKSVSKAQFLNAVLPGAGYSYVGQQRAALTSFFLNALFIAASYQLFDRGYVPAGIILTSLELGWYFGGINGAGLAAKEYNERLYEGIGRETLIENKLFPLLTMQMCF